MAAPGARFVNMLSLSLSLSLSFWDFFFFFFFFFFPLRPEWDDEFLLAVLSRKVQYASRMSNRTAAKAILALVPPVIPFVLFFGSSLSLPRRVTGGVVPLLPSCWVLSSSRSSGDDDTTWSSRGFPLVLTSVVRVMAGVCAGVSSTSFGVRTVGAVMEGVLSAEPTATGLIESDPLGVGLSNAPTGLPSGTVTATGAAVGTAVVTVVLVVAILGTGGYQKRLESQGDTTVCCCCQETNAKRVGRTTNTGSHKGTTPINNTDQHQQHRSLRGLFGSLSTSFGRVPGFSFCDRKWVPE